MRKQSLTAATPATGLSAEPLAASSTRDRLLLAAATLLHESGDRTVSTRAICDLAGVQAPTLYHHFGSKQGLIDAVINHGFTQYVAQSGSGATASDPFDSIREGWDRHVAFGLELPGFYALVHGAVVPGRPCAIAGPAREMLAGLLERAARAGQLRVPPVRAAETIFAANVGVTLSLISFIGRDAPESLSDGVREAVLRSLMADAPGEPRQPGAEASPTPASAAIALASSLDGAETNLSFGESALLGELLAKLSR